MKKKHYKERLNNTVFINANILLITYVVQPLFNRNANLGVKIITHWLYLKWKYNVYNL